MPEYLNKHYSLGHSLKNENNKTTAKQNSPLSVAMPYFCDHLSLFIVIVLSVTKVTRIVLKETKYKSNLNF